MSLQLRNLVTDVGALRRSTNIRSQKNKQKTVRGPTVDYKSIVNGLNGCTQQVLYRLGELKITGWKNHF